MKKMRRAMMALSPCAKRRTLVLLLAVPPCLLLLAICTLNSFRLLGFYNPDKAEPPQGLVLNLRAANSGDGGASSSIISSRTTVANERNNAQREEVWLSVAIPEEMPPSDYPPGVAEYMTGLEIMSLWTIHNTSDQASSNNAPDGGHAIEVGGDYPSRCSEVDMAALAKGMGCGAPLSAPCFDRGRCRPKVDGGPGPSVYVYDEDCSLENSSSLPPSHESMQLSPTWREAAREVGILSETYESACFFVHVNKGVDAPCPTRSPLWNGGANHVMVDLTDLTRRAG